MKIIKYFFLTFIALLGVSFACLNAQTVAINYYIGNILLPLSLLIAMTLVIGSFLGIFAMISLYFRQKTLLFRLQHRLKLAEKELANLRVIPLKENDTC